MTQTRILDHDVREVIEDFIAHAEADGVRLQVLSGPDPTLALTHGS